MHPPTLLIVGGGLAGLMTAWRRLTAHPSETAAIVEAGDVIAGDHTWSFNPSDVDVETHAFLKPFIAHEWPRYDVRFPKLQRTLKIPYATGNSETLRSCVKPLIDEGRLKILTNARAAAIDPTSVTLEDQTTLTANTVLDARGGKPGPHMRLGYQKFVGHTVITASPHGLDHPIIMDATVDQTDGYRFVYCLPFAPDKVLIEDTYYADGADLDEETVAARIAAYAEAQGWTIKETERTERGVLPIALASDIDAGLALDGLGAPRIGLAGGLFHPTTGYSLPDAVAVAGRIAALPYLEPDSVKTTLDAYKRDHWERGEFFRLLNRMLFKAAKDGERYVSLERFYSFNEDLIRRFYAGHVTFADKARVLCGKPPVPLGKAIYNLSESNFLQRTTGH